MAFQAINDTEIESGAPITSDLMTKIKDSLDALDEASDANRRGWWLKIADYDNKSLDISSQDSKPESVFISPDGMSLFVVGSTNQKVYQYTLSTAWDLSTATFASKELDVGSYFSSGSPHGLRFKPDGTQLYVIDINNDDIYQIPLTTAWDVSSVGSEQSYSLSTATDPRGFDFSSDGTKLYVMGTSSDTVYQYPLSTAWDITSASTPTSKTLSETSSPRDVAFSSDGKRMLTLSEGGDIAHQYDLATAWDVTSALYNGTSYSMDVYLDHPEGFAFSPDGVHMYVADETNQAVFQFVVGASF